MMGRVLLLLVMMIALSTALCTPLETNIVAEIRQLVQSGQLSTARWVALQHLNEHHSTGGSELRKSLSSAFVDAFDHAITSQGRKDYFDKLYGALQQEKSTNSSVGSRRNLAKRDNVPDCVPAVPFGSDDPTLAWDECCSILPQQRSNAEGNQKTANSKSLSGMMLGDGVLDSHALDDDGCDTPNPCCNFFVGSSSHLRLPALHEPALAVRLMASDEQRITLDLEQDGHLRLFDVAGILWPSGYLLALCMSNPTDCGIQGVLDRAWSRQYQILSNEPRSRPFAIELGAGIGAASISLALYLQQYEESERSHRQQHTSPAVVATDVAPYSLALTISNAWHNDANLAIDFLNNTNISSVEEAREKHFPTTNGTGKVSKHCGFAIVMGSSLQLFFQDSDNPSSNLWKTLDILLDQNNPHAVAIFVHVRSYPLLPPSDGSFELIEQLSGDRFGMQTRTGDSSDFEIFVFRRRAESDNTENEL
jgi:hypothetical protein